MLYITEVHSFFGTILYIAIAVKSNRPYIILCRSCSRSVLFWGVFLINIACYINICFGVWNNKDSMKYD